MEKPEKLVALESLIGTVEYCKNNIGKYSLRDIEFKLDSVKNRRSVEFNKFTTKDITDTYRRQVDALGYAIIDLEKVLEKKKNEIPFWKKVLKAIWNTIKIVVPNPLKDMLDEFFKKKLLKAKND